MAYDPRDKHQTDGRANRVPAETWPNDHWGRSLQRQDEPGPDWGRGTENALERKRGLQSRVPGYGGYRTRKPGE